MLEQWQQLKYKLRGYVAHYVDDGDLVDDILQEVYLKAHTQLHQLKAKGSLSAWLYRIAHNTIMDHYRRTKPHEPLPEELAQPQTEQVGLAHQQVAQCIRPFIDELADKYRQPLIMAELEGQTQQQIADALSLSLSGAKSRVQRGRQQLKRKLTACCDFEVGQDGVLDYQPKQKGCQC